MEVNDTWRFIFRHVPGALWFSRMIVFLYLEGTAVRFTKEENGVKARNESAERSKAYIRQFAPSEL